jgi:hypothetical protein
MVKAPHLNDPSLIMDPHEFDNLEQRVHRLEDAVAAMQDTRLLEERVVERMAGRINGNTPTAAASTTGIIIEAGRHLVPAVMEGASSPDIHPALDENSGARSPWLIMEIYDEFRTIYWMFLDPAYRVSWTGRIAPVAILCVLVMSWWISGGIIGGLMDKLLGLVLAVIAYKVLTKEARRYRQMLPHFPSRARR